MNKKLGYYTCGDLEFESKIQAFLHSKKINKPVEWIFNDYEFLKHNWTVEPELSIDCLYDLRVKSLREKYDYLILSYSGGADSHNILTSFIRQGIHLDEIIVNTMEKGSSSFTKIDYDVKDNTNSNAEHYLQTLPRLKEIEHLIPKTKITILDLTDHLFSMLETADDESWILNRREKLNPVGITRFNYIHFSDVRKQFDKGKKIGIILGIDKPKSLIIDNKFYLRFNDRTANMVSIVNHFEEYTNSAVEYFYWSPDCVPLLIKQGHIIMRWLKAFPQYQKFWDTKTTSYEIVVKMHERLLRNVIYTNWDSSWFQVEKPIHDWFCEYDNWFIEGCKGTRANDIWKRGVDYAQTLLLDDVRFTQGKADGLKFFIKKYYLGNINDPN